MVATPFWNSGEIRGLRVMAPRIKSSGTTAL
jgi:hypothetical protein